MTIEWDNEPELSEMDASDTLSSRLCLSIAAGLFVLAGLSASFGYYNYPPLSQSMGSEEVYVQKLPTFTSHIIIPTSPGL
jgi:heme/copper-type cytochrome/quinol oxidase subunit 1